MSCEERQGPSDSGLDLRHYAHTGACVCYQQRELPLCGGCCENVGIMRVSERHQYRPRSQPTPECAYLCSGWGEGGLARFLGFLGISSKSYIFLFYKTEYCLQTGGTFKVISEKCQVHSVKTGIYKSLCMSWLCSPSSSSPFSPPPPPLLPPLPLPPPTPSSLHPVSHFKWL